MTDAEVRRTEPSWIWGGGLLAASAVVPWALGPGGAGTLTRTLAGLLFLAAMAVFAFGLRGAGSVVARRGAGMVALLVLGITPLLFSLVAPTQVDLSDMALLQTLGYVELAVTAAAALVAVVEIARARVVPGPWRWAPAIGLAVVVGVQVIGQIVGVAVGPQGLEHWGVALALGGFVSAVVVPLVLGGAAMALGGRGLPAASPRIYPSA